MFVGVYARMDTVRIFVKCIMKTSLLVFVLLVILVVLLYNYPKYFLRVLGNVNKDLEIQVSD